MKTSHSYVPSNFVIQELIPPTFFHKYGNNAIRYIDPRICDVLSVVRDWIGKPMTINNWHTGGQRLWSGLRTADSPHYRSGSAHSFGQAFDAVGDWDANLVRQAILDGELILPHWVRLETNITWLHVDVMAVQQKVETFKP